MTIQYPVTRRDDSVSDTFKSAAGPAKVVNDPYRWLEEPSSDETKAWVEQQNKVTTEYLSKDGDLTKRLESELMERINFAKFGWTRRRGDRLFFDKNPGLANQSIIYMADANDPSKEAVLLDPNQFSTDGTWSLSSMSISRSGKLVAYGYSKGGSDWVTLKVLRVPDVIGGPVEILEDTIEWVKFSYPEFDEKEQGFLYARFPENKQLSADEKGTETDSNINQKMYYHRIGEQQSQDTLVYQSTTNPEYLFGGNFTNDNKYLMVHISKDCNPESNLSIITNWNQVIYDKTETEFKEIKLITNFNASYNYLHNVDGKFWFHTNLNAPMNRVITIDLPAKEGDALNITEVIKEREYLNQYAHYTSQKLYVVFLRDVQDVVEVFELHGKLIRPLPLPAPGCIGSLGGLHDSPHIYFSFESFTYPKTSFYLNTNDDVMSVFREPNIKNFVPTDYECKQEFYQSKDGTKIPMFVVHKKNFVANGQAPVFLTAYGGFEYPYSPAFSLNLIFFVDKFNGAFVVANIRGGGEYGKKWHDAGRLKNKQNSYDDIAAGVEYLFEKKYTSADKLTINGGSNGGLMVAACTNQRPELFGCCIADVGVFDMLRFQKFTIGRHWVSDYGCSDEPEQFDTLIKYSPLHNVNANKKYPHVLLVTGDHDDRVIPAHSYKYISELQYQRGNKPDQTDPLLILVDVQAGHGAGKPLSKRVHEFCTKLTFISIATKSKPN
ncbi:hypothetical protein SAMD00019534_121890 [Acytostelium subglobosum LB1]|uniref:hypothetical protein n=1 Tax=Acytostelium subglobosum LB1 TaxID=1410327 RepID=UPI000644C0F5|nr:hypothetical protein SAMD00019534_121890 [Acytostelium subglobosum LB1]GAM29013.1 hypothetical protein SAMD00019534_121890 [Acytostelium subglobosum LB1]|eukprot:XP_012748019.1 hypothetical protein SAMD00019534_121890 [Acytostelium subglobosum LB1]